MKIYKSFFTILIIISLFLIVETKGSLAEEAVNGSIVSAPVQEAESEINSPPYNSDENYENQPVENQDNFIPNANENYDEQDLRYQEVGETGEVNSFEYQSEQGGIDEYAGGTHDNQDENNEPITEESQFLTEGEEYVYEIVEDDSPQGTEIFQESAEESPLESEAEGEVYTENTEYENYQTDVPFEDNAEDQNSEQAEDSSNENAGSQLEN